jgi:glycosyltransferase involved in cell wall biosynthesis
MRSGTMSNSFIVSREGDSVHQSPLSSRPRISVCMATYNGERYIEDQLASILVQLSAEDEVIVVDDASTDQTRELVGATCDSRIRLLVNDHNCGVLLSFERALLNSSGDILLLSDQDDVWQPQKVATILEAFANNPEIMVIQSDSSIIDENGHRVADSYYSTRSRFTTSLIGNLVHFRYQGCGMALRREIFPAVFPFPHGFDVLHDLWIGLRCTTSGHKTCYLNSKLFQYRRHSSNASYTLPRSRQFRVRLHLVVSLLLDGARRCMCSIAGGLGRRERSNKYDS